MNKKGFTLTELMTVVAIITIIVLIAVPSIIAISRNMNTRLYNNKVEIIIKAAELYATNNPDVFNGRLQTSVTVNELLNKDYVSADLKNSSNCSGIGCVINPVDKTSMNDDCVRLKKEAVGVNGEYLVGCNENSTQVVEGTLVEQVCKKFNNGSFTGKYGSGENDYCGCKFSGENVTGIYRAAKNEHGTLTVGNTSVNACIISGDNVNNYLKYDGVMWRVMGVYNIYNNQNKLVVKIITNDTVDNQ